MRHGGLLCGVLRLTADAAGRAARVHGAGVTDETCRIAAATDAQAEQTLPQAGRPNFPSKLRKPTVIHHFMNKFSIGKRLALVLGLMLLLALLGSLFAIAQLRTVSTEVDVMVGNDLLAERRASDWYLNVY